SGLSEGSHTFSVEAQDAAGNVSAITSFTWTVDTTPPPAPTFESQPSNPSNSGRPSFAFADTESGVTFLTRLDKGSFAGASNPQSLSGLSDGSHIFAVKALDAAGNVS